jgi:two-component system NarL family sensor kinase
VRRALALTRSTLDEARRSVLELRAAPLEGRTLAEALTALAEDLRAGGSGTVRVSHDGETRSLPPAVEVGLYRIAREALTNVARHANAAEVTVHVAVGPERVRMQVEDDGVGFDPARVPPGRYGLIGMTERARLLGGTLTIESAPGEGTTVAADVPLRSATGARA